MIIILEMRKKNYEKGDLFRFMLSTRRLLEAIIFGKVQHADTTYKLMWNLYPVFVFGIMDAHQRFFPIGIAASKSTFQGIRKRLEREALVESIFVGTQVCFLF